MRLGHPAYAIAERESPSRVHRLSAIAGRAYCGQVVVALPKDRARSNLLVCRRCAAIDDARRDGMPTFDDDDEI